MKEIRRITLWGLAVFTIWVTTVQAQAPFKTLFAEGYDFLSTKESAYSTDIQPRQPKQGSAFHTLFGEGYAVLEQHDQPTSTRNVAPVEPETSTALTPFRAIFGRGYDFASSQG